MPINVGSYSPPSAGVAPDVGTFAINRAIPGLPKLTGQATDIIGNLLGGLPSVDQTRQANAWFGAGSGLDPSSEFLRNRGYDLYGEKAQGRQQQGLQNLLGLIGGYSGAVAPTPGQELSQRESAADRAQRAAEAAMANALGQSRLDFEQNAYWGIAPKNAPDWLSIVLGQKNTAPSDVHIVDDLEKNPYRP